MVIIITTARAVMGVVTTTLCSQPSISGIFGVTQQAAPCFPLNKSDDSMCPVIKGTMIITTTRISRSGQPLNTNTFIILKSL